MIQSEVKAKRRWWRPRFSVRTLVILITLVCMYFGAWEATKRHGCDKALALDGSRIRIRNHSPAALVVQQDEFDIEDFIRQNGVWLEKMHRNRREPPPSVNRPRRYYLWLFGPLIKLPFESES